MHKQIGTWELHVINSVKKNVIIFEEKATLNVKIQLSNHQWFINGLEQKI